jgi:hypothetical protein
VPDLNQVVRHGHHCPLSRHVPSLPAGSRSPRWLGPERFVSYRFVSPRGYRPAGAAHCRGRRGTGPVSARVANPSLCGRDMQAEQVREYGGGEVGGEGYDRGVPGAA